MEYKNYRTIFEKEIEALKSKALLLKHEKTGARVFILSNDDNNKVFYIGFRTPPTDDTGIAAGPFLQIVSQLFVEAEKTYPLSLPAHALCQGKR